MSDMETTTTREAKMDITETEAARLWDSEKRNSPFSTVADVEDEEWDGFSDPDAA